MRPLYIIAICSEKVIWSESGQEYAQKTVHMVLNKYVGGFR